MNRIFAPLQADHPAVRDGKTCALCSRAFAAGERVTLISVTPRIVSTVQAAIVHASCAFRGVYVDYQGKRSEIDRIKDGDASPYPVILCDGRQLTIAEAGLEGE